jgi:hypothetical protein
LVVASVVLKRERVAVTRLPTAWVVTLIVGFPVVPVAVEVASTVVVVLMPVNDAAASFMASVAPVTVTDMVLAPVVVGTKYQSSVAMPPLLALPSFVNEPPFHLADVMVPEPPTSCQISPYKMRMVLVPAVATVCVQVLVTGPVAKPVVIEVDVASSVGVEVAVPPPDDPPVLDAFSTVASKRLPAKMCLVVVAAPPIIAL